MLESAAFFARIGNRIISAIVAVFIVIMLLYGGYSIWDTTMMLQGAYVSNDLLKFKPSITEPDRPTLSELKKINPDVRGWITIDDTHIDYPVVQGKNDMEYINKDVYGEFALSGSIFMDSRNRADFSDSYSLLYGHNMENGAMFGDVIQFSEKDYFDSHRTGTLYLDDRYALNIEIFACTEIDAFDSRIYDPTSWENTNMHLLLDYIKSIAVQYREMDFSDGDRIIGLSTCAEAETNGRVVLFGRLTKSDQNLEGGV